jgi:hypothetical protein
MPSTRESRSRARQFWGARRCSSNLQFGSSTTTLGNVGDSLGRRHGPHRNDNALAFYRHYPAAWSQLGVFDLFGIEAVAETVPQEGVGAEGVLVLIARESG